MAFYSLDDVVKMVIGWERDLDHFYKLMLHHLKNEKTRQAVQILKVQQDKVISALNKINVDEYKQTEYIKYIPDFTKDDVIPHCTISENTTVVELFDKVLDYEEKLEDYYKHLLEVVKYTKSKDLMNMLIEFKLGQIKQIKALMESSDLAL